MDAKRRLLLRAGLSAAPVAFASGAAVAASGGADTRVETIALWPSARMPGGSGPSGAERVSAQGSLTNVSTPRLLVYRPARPNGTAMLVAGGGGYAHIEHGHESEPACRWLQSVGVTAFELIYRLPDEGWERSAPLQDGQRAMRTIRALTARDGADGGAHSGTDAGTRYGIDPSKIGVLGFSAGGHLAGMTATTASTARYAAVDAIDEQPSRPDFAALIYPVLTLMPPFDHTRTRRSIVGRQPSVERSEAFSVDHQVGAGTPAVFLAQAKDDPVSPVDNSLLMFNASRAAGIDVEMHIFASGGHGWGMGKPGSPERAWPRLFADWATFNRFWIA